MQCSLCAVSGASTLLRMKLGEDDESSRRLSKPLRCCHSTQKRREDSLKSHSTAYEWVSTFDMYSRHYLYKNLGRVGFKVFFAGDFFFNIFRDFFVGDFHEYFFDRE